MILSKRFMALIVVSILIFTGSMLVVQSKKIAQPLVIPLGVQLLYEHATDDSFTISYIVNRDEQINLSYVNVGGLQLSAHQFPDVRTFNIFFLPTDNIVNKYIYYDLKSVKVDVREENRDVLKQLAQQEVQATAVFSNGATFSFPLQLEFRKHPKDQILIGKSSNDMDGDSLSTFTTNEAIVIEEIKTTFPRAKIQLLKKEQVLTLPYKAQKGEQLNVRISHNYLYKDAMTNHAVFYGKTQSGENFSEEMIIEASDFPPEQWIENFVEEAGGN